VLVVQGKFQSEKKEKTILAIPYYAWANRGQCRMAVWLKRDENGR
jgi:DUF1680 family protein